jgi:Ca2+-binding RTX toxin-like protein
MAVTATFSNGIGILDIDGDTVNNTITARRSIAGEILVNGGAVPIQGDVPTVGATTLIRIDGAVGVDTIALDETNGALPAAELTGGIGNDSLTGGSGNDTFVWNPDDGNDTIEGQAGTDELLFSGSDASENINISANGGRVQFSRDVASVTMDLNDVERINVNALGGADNVVVNDLSGTDVTQVNLDLRASGGGGDGAADTVTVNGTQGDDVVTVAGDASGVTVTGLQGTVSIVFAEAANDRLVLNGLGGEDVIHAGALGADGIQLTINGGLGEDILFGGAGGDLINGGDGDDIVVMGAGNDTFVWNPGDDNDIIEGEADTDTLEFNGASIAESIGISANGGRVRFTRNIAAVTMDLNDVEQINVSALGDADSVVVNDLTGTDLTEVNVDLAGTLGGSSGDGAADTVAVNGTGGVDTITVTGAGTAVSVTGLPATVAITNAEGANDTLVVNGGGGEDQISATTLPAGVVRLTLDGGAGDDTLLGSQGADTLRGGADHDLVLGDNGNDTAFLGSGDDIFEWNPGDGNDTIEGEAGTDTLLFLGSGASESIDIAANGGRVRFTRDIASVTLDLDDVERINVNALGGADSVVMNDLTGTDVTEVNLDLRASGGGGDGAADTVTVNATQVDDVITVAGDASGVTVTGLQAAVNIFAEVANDRLVLNGLGGEDVIHAGALGADGIQLTINGGLGEDILFGGAGGDLINGGDGDDIVVMGAGNDTFVWSPGDDNDIIEGEAGTDTLEFNGASLAESIDISANGGRVRFTRNIAAVTMDLNDVERINLSALGDADSVVVNDLTGTDLTEVNVDLAGTLGGSSGDGAADTVTVNATQGGDVIIVAGDASGVTMIGLQATVNMVLAEAANDRLVLNVLGGGDVIDASALEADGIQLTMNGGLGDDVLVGSAGGDVINGGDGDDTTLMGAGNDTFVWNPGDDNDTIEGLAGTDTLELNGAADLAESIDISANGGRVRFTRDIASVTMDLNSVERINFSALSGADSVVVNDLTGTGLTEINVDLAGTLGGSSGDGAADTVAGNGTGGADTITVIGAGTAVSVTGLAATVAITNAEGANDALVVNGAGGEDQLSATTMLAGVVRLTLDGGAGDDSILGSQGADTLRGGADHDLVLGDNGDDTAFLGSGDDIFEWNPDDGSDTIEGEAGTDTLLFFGSGASESIDIAANGGRVLLSRDIANVTMDLDDVERINLSALGGADNVLVNDLAGTGLTEVNVGLAGTLGGSIGDGAADTVAVNGTGGADTITVIGAGTAASVTGLPATVAITNAEGANDTLVVNGGGGGDTIAATALAGVMKLTIDAGAGDDTILGSLGADILRGGAENDTLTGDHGNDSLDGGAGNDRVIYRIGDGADEILDFVAGAGTDDLIDLTTVPLVETLDELLARATQAGADTVIDLGNGDTLTLRNVVRASLSTDDFLFGAFNDAPVNALPTATEVEANTATAIAGLAVTDDATGNGNLTTTLGVEHGTLAASGVGVSGSGTATVTITGTLGQINAALATVTYTGEHDFFGADALTMSTNDNGNTGSGAPSSDTDEMPIAVGPILTGSGGDDSFNAPAGNARIDGLGGFDTVSFGFKLIEATVGYVDNTIVIDGPSSHTVLTGVERFAFTDGTIDNADSSPLIDDLFYNSQNHDVWSAHIDADFHYNAIGWREGRDPSAFFETSLYLWTYPDVAAGGGNPLTHFDTVGWKEFRVPSLEFGTRQYFDANPDVKAAQLDPLWHFLAVGAGEGRLPVAPSELIGANGFDFVHYLADNPDVAAAGVDPFLHFQTIGWKEGRDPNALFDTSGYLDAYADVADAHVNPLDHYNLSGWKEGRDPSGGFDTTDYLAANPDVAAAHFNPLVQFLAFGVHEGRSPQADGAFS